MSVPEGEEREGGTLVPEREEEEGTSEVLPGRRRAAAGLQAPSSPGGPGGVCSQDAEAWGGLVYPASASSSLRLAPVQAVAAAETPASPRAGWSDGGRCASLAAGESACELSFLFPLKPCFSKGRRVSAPTRVPVSLSPPGSGLRAAPSFRPSRLLWAASYYSGCICFSMAGMLSRKNHYF